MVTQGIVPARSALAAGGREPARRLARDLGDVVEVLVVMQDRHCGGLRRRRDQQIGVLDRSLMRTATPAELFDTRDR
jgi:hypothetical protein